MEILPVIADYGVTVATLVACFWYINKKDKEHISEKEKLTLTYNDNLKGQNERHFKELESATNNNEKLQAILTDNTEVLIELKTIFTERVK